MIFFSNTVMLHCSYNYVVTCAKTLLLSACFLLVCALALPLSDFSGRDEENCRVIQRYSFWGVVIWTLFLSLLHKRTSVLLKPFKAAKAWSSASNQSTEASIFTSSLFLSTITEWCGVSLLAVFYLCLVVGFVVICEK